MKLLELIPRHRGEPGSLLQTGTQGFTFSVEIFVESEGSATGKRYYRWGMPVYLDDGGEYIDFSGTSLKELLGKIYLSELEGDRYDE